MRTKILLTPLLVFGLLLATALPVLADQMTEPKVVAIDRDNLPATSGDLNRGYGTNMALLDNGTLWAWGYNDYGQIGDNTTENRLSPIMVPIDHVVDASVCWGYAVAVKDDGTVWEWGNVGDKRNITIVTAPRQIPDLSNVRQVIVGPTHCFAIKHDGTIWAWGSNRCGELGIGKTDGYYLSTPVQVPITGVRQISLGAYYTMVLKNDGTVWAAGEGASGLGYGDYETQWSFIQVPISNITAISCGPSGCTLALKDDGTIWGWGENGFYQLGNYTQEDQQPTPIMVGRLIDVVAVSAGYQYSIALKKDGTVWAWGTNNIGSLGTGVDGYFETPDPVRVTGLDHVVAISAGEGPGLALKDDGTIWTWGTTNHSIPFQSDPKPRQVFVGVPTPDIFPEPINIVTSEPQPADDAPYAEFENATVVAQSLASSVNDTIRSLAPDGAGGLYAFGDHTIYRMTESGEKIWGIDIPSQWQINDKYWRPAYNYRTTATMLAINSQPVFDTHDGYLYLYLTPSDPYPRFDNDYGYDMDIDADKLSWALMAISPEGEIAWTQRLETNLEFQDATNVQATGDRIYLFHNYNETVLDKNGRILFTIPDISDPAAVDESGHLYVTRTIRTYIRTAGSGYCDYRLPSSTIEAYDSAGTLLWSKDVGENLFRQSVAEEIRSDFSTLPLYQNRTLYLPVKNGVIALDTNGNEKWSRCFNDGYYGLFNLMPVDQNSNLYLGYYGKSGESPHPFKLYVVDSDGRVIAGPVTYSYNYAGDLRPAAKDGIIYGVRFTNLDNKTPVDNLPCTIITAFDIRNNTNLWAYKIALGNKSLAVIDDSNQMYFKNFLDTGILDPVENDDYFLGRNLTVAPPLDFANSAAFVSVVPGDDVVYVSFRALKYEYPVKLGESEAAYASGIYAFSPDGKPLVKAESGSLISAMAVNNSTFFFSTIDGKISAVTLGVVTGLAVLGAIAVAVKFFLFGSVARARSRIDKNGNRNQLLDYVKAHPGLTQYELSRGTGMNMGTVRYHLFILSMNHKIATFNDGKFVRYFPNSNFYSKEEQMIISLIRRETIGKIIHTLIITPGLTNAELSRTLEQPNSAISKLTKELCVRGIAIKEEMDADKADGKFVYFIKDEYIEKAVNLSEKINS